MSQFNLALIHKPTGMKDWVFWGGFPPYPMCEVMGYVAVCDGDQDGLQETTKDLQ